MILTCHPRSSSSLFFSPRLLPLLCAAVHPYFCDTSQTMAALQAAHDRYKLPLWLTEFACGFGSQGSTADQHLAYMKAVVPLLEASPLVDRYYWMQSSGGTHPARNLVDASGVLTPLGEAYLAL